MKKVISTLLAAVLLAAAVCGCGTGTSGAAATEAAATEAAATEAAATEAAETKAAETEAAETKAAETEAPAAAADDAAAINEEEYFIIDSNTDVADAFDTVWWNSTDLCRLMLFDRLVQCDEEGNPNKPQLAKEFSASEDGLTYTFVLRDDVRWHDGEAFTADDVLWSIETALKSARVASAISGQLNNIEGAAEYIAGTAESVSGISAEGNVVTIKLVDRSSAFLEAMSMFAPLPKHLLEGTDPAVIHTSEYWQAPVGNGAYKFDQFAVGEYFTFVRNEDYYGSKAKINHVKALICNAADYTVLAAADGLDYFQTRDVATIEDVLTNDHYTGTIFPVVYTRQFTYNLKGYKGAADGKTAVSDIRVRQALRYALDIDTIIETIYGEYATPIYSQIPQNIPGYTDEIDKFEYDPEKAKALLAEAGWDSGYTLRILEYFGDTATHDFLDMVVAYFDAVGVKAEYFNAGADAVAAIYDIMDYDLCLGANNNGRSKGMQYSVLCSTSGFQNGEPNDFDALYPAYNAAASFEEQTEIFRTMQQTEAKYVYTIPLYTMQYYAMVNSAKLETEGVNFLGDGFNYDRGLDKIGFKAEYFK